MSISRNLLKILAVGALVLPMHAASQSRGEMTFYSQIGFGGQTYTVTGPRENVRIPFTVRSARLARGETWEVCTDNSYRGRCNLVNEDQGNVAWIVGSVRPAAGTLPTPQPGYSELTLYSQIGFRGQSYTVTGPRTSIRIPFTARSARMTGGGTWEICTSTDYRGRCNTVSEDQGNVAWVVGSARPAGGATPLPPRKPVVAAWDGVGLLPATIRFPRPGSGVQPFERDRRMCIPDRRSVLRQPGLDHFQA